MSGDTGPWVTTTTILHDLRDAGNAPAWERLVGRFRAPLRGFVLGLGAPESDADDVTQEALLEFARLYREGRYDPGKGRLSSWLFGIAHTCALRQRQKAARRREATAGAAEDLPGWPGLVDEQSAQELWKTEWERWAWTRCMERAREEFEPATFRAFVLQVQDGLSAPDAAEALGVPVKVVYNAKHRVLQRLRALRDELEGQG